MGLIPTAPVREYILWANLCISYTQSALCHTLRRALAEPHTATHCHTLPRALPQTLPRRHCPAHCHTHCHTLPATAAHYRTLPHCHKRTAAPPQTAAHCRTTAAAHCRSTAAHCRTPPHNRTAAHCRAYCHTLPRTLPHTAACALRAHQCAHCHSTLHYKLALALLALALLALPRTATQMILIHINLYTTYAFLYKFMYEGGSFRIYYLWIICELLGTI
jgi:hypothetical protein